MSPWRSTRLATWLLIATAVLASGMMILAVVYGPDLLRGVSTSEAVKRSGDLAACRSTYAAAVEVATANLDDARGTVSLLTNEGLEAIATGDDERLALLVPKLAPARRLVEDRQAERAAVVDAFSNAVELSRTDPSEFLRQCETTAIPSEVSE